MTPVDPDLAESEESAPALSRRNRRRQRRRSERGVSLVEYALVVAVLVVPTIGAVQLVRNAAQTKINTTAAGISTHTIPTVTTAP